MSGCQTKKVGPISTDCRFLSAPPSDPCPPMCPPPYGGYRSPHAKICMDNPEACGPGWTASPRAWSDSRPVGLERQQACGPGWTAGPQTWRCQSLLVNVTIMISTIEMVHELPFYVNIQTFSHKLFWTSIQIFFKKEFGSGG